MNWLRPSPVGVDAVINQFQLRLYRDLMANGWKNWDCYPRVYKIQKNGETIPSYYKNTGDYYDTRFNDKAEVTSFFLVDEKRELNDKQTIWTQDISIIFQARLDKLFCNYKDRPDELFINKIQASLRRIAYDKYKMKVLTGVDKVYSDLKLTQLKRFTDDMNNFSVVKFTFTMLYTNTLNPSRI